jgi:hypothetical protein
MKILRARRVGQLADLTLRHFKQGVCRFGKEKRRVALRIPAHFADMACVIAPDTPNAPHRVAL